MKQKAGIDEECDRASLGRQASRRAKNKREKNCFDFKRWVPLQGMLELHI